jgi:hypothetical protein
MKSILLKTIFLFLVLGFGVFVVRQQVMLLFLDREVHLLLKIIERQSTEEVVSSVSSLGRRLDEREAASRRFDIPLHPGDSRIVTVHEGALQFALDITEDNKVRRAQISKAEYY